MTTDEEFEKYRKADGTIDWGRRATDNLSSIIDSEEKRNDKKPLALEELSIYKLAGEISDKVWAVVVKWDWFAKKTVGDQMVRAADSIAANIAEGYGRYFFGEYLVFLYYSRGSLFETKFWLEKARKRLNE